ncbi:hypothetical protein BU16DRAFT_125485 [Lophium mytilinum]|uniref:Uncharacterized protein n=1 Tax=Lophium mytilinum TaxID=390894 RepID=A0A6A6QI77_9PEZI|nr:hypothetical protein BU16DRAFT_125485 [Lophium mytilinum]
MAKRKKGPKAPRRKKPKEAREETPWRPSDLMNLMDKGLEDLIGEEAFRHLYKAVTDLDADGDATVSISQWNSLIEMAESSVRSTSDPDMSPETLDGQDGYSGSKQPESSHSSPNTSEEETAAEEEPKATNSEIYHPTHDLEPKDWADYTGRILHNWSAEKSLAEVVLHIACSQGFEQATKNTKTSEFLKNCPKNLRGFLFIEGFYKTGEHLVGFILPNQEHPRAMDFRTAVAQAPVFVTPCTDLDLTLAKDPSQGWQHVTSIIQDATEEQDYDSDATEIDDNSGSDDDITDCYSANISEVLNGKHRAYYKLREGLPIYTLVQLRSNYSLFVNNELTTPNTRYRGRQPPPGPDEIWPSKPKRDRVGCIQREIDSSSGYKISPKGEENDRAHGWFSTALKWVEEEHRRNRRRGCEKRWL